MSRCQILLETIIKPIKNTHIVLIHWIIKRDVCMNFFFHFRLRMKQNEIGIRINESFYILFILNFRLIVLETQKSKVRLLFLSGTFRLKNTSHKCALLSAINCWQSAEQKPHTILQNFIKFSMTLSFVRGFHCC